MDHLWRYEFPEGRVSNGAFTALVADRIVWQAFGHGIQAVSLDGAAVWHHPSDSSVPFFGRRDRLFIGGERAQSVDVRTGNIIAARDSQRRVRVMAPTDDCARYWEATENPRRETMLGLALEDLSLLWAVPPPAGRVKWIGEWYYEYDESTSQVTVRRPPSMDPRGRFHVDPDLWYFHPLMTDDVLIFQTADRVHAIDAFDGQTLWQRTLAPGSGFNRTIDGTFYLCSNPQHAIEPRTGRELWSVETEAPPTDLAITGDTLWLSTTNNRLRALDRRTGQITTPAAATRLAGSVIKMWALTPQDLVLLVYEPGEQRVQREVLCRIAAR